MYTRLIVQVTDTAFPKTMMVPIGEQLIFGRSDEDDLTFTPDVDLVACNAIRNGVSRQHALIQPQPDGSFVLYDMGSRNGTVLNGHELDPHQPYPVTDGDKIQLGRLLITIYFE